jgi:hypothetical protein
MAVTVEMHNTGDAELQRDVVAMIEHVLSHRPGTWWVVIISPRGSDRWEMRITGPNAFERSCTLEGAGPASTGRSWGSCREDGAGQIVIRTCTVRMYGVATTNVS